MQWGLGCWGELGRRLGVVGWCRGFDTALAHNSLAGLKPGGTGRRAGGRGRPAPTRLPPHWTCSPTARQGRPPGESWPEGWLPSWCIPGHDVKSKDPALLQRSLSPDMVLFETSLPNISELNTWKINSVLQEPLVVGIRRSLSRVAVLSVNIPYAGNLVFVSQGTPVRVSWGLKRFGSSSVSPGGIISLHTRSSGQLSVTRCVCELRGCSCPLSPSPHLCCVSPSVWPLGRVGRRVQVPP